jgi:proteasome lid subunit RPN8/RPN11
VIVRPRHAEQAVLTIPAAIHAAMLSHCLMDAPLECCGVLGGVFPWVSLFYPLRNADLSEVTYNADPRDILLTVRDLRAREAEMLAIYHSHPHSKPIPSRIDLHTNYYGDLPRLIVSLLGETPEVRVWRLQENAFQELPWRIVP